jgi:hypothetical protein
VLVCVSAGHFVKCSDLFLFVAFEAMKWKPCVSASIAAAVVRDGCLRQSREQSELCLLSVCLVSVLVRNLFTCL